MLFFEILSEFILKTRTKISANEWGQKNKVTSKGKQDDFSDPTGRHFARLSTNSFDFDAFFSPFASQVNLSGFKYV